MKDGPGDMRLLISVMLRGGHGEGLKGPEAALAPPDPGEPVPSVPPVENADGSPLRYGGLRTAFSSLKARFKLFNAFGPLVIGGLRLPSSDTRLRLISAWSLQPFPMPSYHGNYNNK